ncbi:hypothetical protein V6N13_123769 [Hibiscus sabdariffa]|uniref:Uncharacterized protein n=1 Tax=Hibiscus sabdariffa TaxID=183260 RepID=A0ABR2QUJ1_9ROSI
MEKERARIWVSYTSIFMAVAEPKVEQEDKAPKRDDDKQGEFVDTLGINEAAAGVVLVCFGCLVPAIVAVVSTCHVHNGMPISWFLHVSSVQGNWNGENKKSGK